MSSTRARAANASATAAITAGIAALRDVRHGFEQGHGSTLRCRCRCHPSQPHRTSAPMSHYRSISALQRDLANCRRCLDAGYPIESHAGRPRQRRASARISTARRPDRRGSGRRAVARPRRPHAAPLARARRGDVLRHLLLRLGDALLSGSHRRRARRPHADSRRAPTLLRRGARRSCGSSGPISSSPWAVSRRTRSSARGR